MVKDLSYIVSLLLTRIVSYYVGLSSFGLGGLVWYDLVHLNLVRNS